MSSIIVGELSSGMSLFPISPVNTVFVVFPSSSTHNSIMLEPSMCPASLNRTCILSVMSIMLSYCTASNICRHFAASSAVYNGSLGFSPLRILFLFFHSDSISCMCPLSGSISAHKSHVALCA